MFRLWEQIHILIDLLWNICRYRQPYLLGVFSGDGIVMSPFASCEYISHLFRLCLVHLLYQDVLDAVLYLVDGFTGGCARAAVGDVSLLPRFNRHVDGFPGGDYFWPETYRHHLSIEFP